MKADFDSEDSIAEINVVPLVDIILVVLIIFMVTAPLVLKPVIDIQLPKASSGQEAPQQALNVSIKPDGQLTVNGQTSSTEQLAVIATQLVKQQTEAAAILQADRAVTLETLTAVIDVIKSAGVKKVAFSIDKK